MRHLLIAAAALSDTARSLTTAHADRMGPIIDQQVGARCSTETTTN